MPWSLRHERPNGRHVAVLRLRTQRARQPLAPLDTERPFITETGYRSFLGVSPEMPKRTVPDKFGEAVINAFAKSECRGRIREIEPGYRGGLMDYFGLGFPTVNPTRPRPPVVVVRETAFVAAFTMMSTPSCANESSGR